MLFSAYYAILITHQHRIQLKVGPHQRTY